MAAVDAHPDPQPTYPHEPSWRAPLDRLRYHWNNTAHPAVVAAHRHADRLRPATPAARSMTGGPGVTLAYAGLPIGHLNVLRLLERRREALGSGPATVEPVATSWSELRRGRFPDADIVLVGAEADRVAQLPRERAFVAPFRVHLVVDTDTDADTIRSRISKRERWEFSRNSRRHDWTLVEDSTLAALGLFYSRMHLPTMRARHREQSRSEPLHVARDCILRHGRLFQLLQDGRPVAGVLCHQSDGTLTTRLLGVLDCDDAHYDSGAFKAVYHLLLQWAATQPAVRRVDFFGTEAFLSKGIFQWKRKFDPHVVLPPNHFRTKRLYLSIRRDTAEVRELLVANPFLRMTGPGGLQPVYPFDAGRPARTDVSAKARSLAEPVLVDLDELLGASPSIPTTAHEEVRDDDAPLVRAGHRGGP
jgi:hypothetical protein